MTAHLTRVKSRLSIHAHRKVRGLLEGEYASMQTGRSMDFNDLREYVRGDDVKDLDWKASARGGSLLVKRYVAIRKHTVLLVVSTGRSMAAMNDIDVPKRDLAVFAAGLLGYLAVRHGDHVACVYGDTERQHALPAGAGEVRLERCLSAVHDATTRDAAPSDLAVVLRYVVRTVKRRTIMVVVSDEPVLSEEAVAMLRRLTVQHEVIFLSIGDLDPTARLDRRQLGERHVVDVDSGAEVPDWLRADPELQAQYAQLVAAESDVLKRSLDALGIVCERVHDHATAVTAIFRLLGRHRHATRR